MGVAHALQTIANSIRQMLGQIHAVMKQTDDIDGLTSATLKTTIPQRRTARRGDARRLCLCPDVLQYLTNVGAVGDEGDDSHLLATQGAPQREHLADAGDQHHLHTYR